MVMLRSCSVHARFMRTAWAWSGGALRVMGQAACLILPLEAGAAGFTPPQGCTLTMTVQQRSCTVAQHYTCESDPAGDQRVVYFTDQGLVYQSRIDRETRWLESTDTVTGTTDTLETGARDDASLATLLATGTDDFDFWTRSDEGERLHHVGRDDLTGKTVIDGMDLDTTRFVLETFSEDGSLLIRRTGTQFVSRETGRFYGGVENASDWQGEAETTNDTPVRFIRPGQPGFGSTKPQYDCNVQMVWTGTGNGAAS